jgi:hypothetical protein
MKLEIDHYSRHKDASPPRLGGNEYLVAEVLDQSYGHSDTYFKVQV